MSYISQIEASIMEFTEAAFVATSPNTNARKKAMKFAARACPDKNIASIMGGSIDWIATKPEHVRAAISRAKDALQTLKSNRPDLD